MRKLVCIAAIALASLAGCASVGTAGSGQIDWDKARQVKEGMSKTELVALMGQPYQVVSRDGKLLYIWVYANVWTGESAHVAMAVKDGKVLEAPKIPDEFK